MWLMQASQPLKSGNLFTIRSGAKQSFRLQVPDCAVQAGVKLGSQLVAVLLALVQAGRQLPTCRCHFACKQQAGESVLNWTALAAAMVQHMSQMYTVPEHALCRALFSMQGVALRNCVPCTRSPLGRDSAVQ